MRNRLLESILLVSLMSVSASAATISNPWLRVLPGDLPAAGYFTLTNDGQKPLVLSGASSPACGMLMLHKSIDAGGMSSMEDETAVTIAPGQTVAFKPGSYHLMCMSPQAGLKKGDTAKVTLTFAGAPALSADFVITDARGRR
jgi:periplasmic copper chaperone A